MAKEAKEEFVREFEKKKKRAQVSEGLDTFLQEGARQKARHAWSTAVSLLQVSDVETVISR